MAPPAQCPTSSPLGFVWESVPPSLPSPTALPLSFVMPGGDSFFPHLCFPSFPSFLLHKPTHVFPALSKPQK